METNKEIKICRASIFFLRLSCVWPDKKEELNPGKYFYIRLVVVLTLFIVMLFGIFSHTFIVFKYQLDIDVSADLGINFGLVGTCYIVILYLTQRQNIAILLGELSDFSQFGLPPNFQETNTKLNFYSKLLFGYCSTGMTVYSVFKYFKIEDCVKYNTEKNANELCGSVTSMWYPTDLTRSSTRHIFIFYIFLVGHLFYKFVSTISYLSFEIASHIILRVNHLNELLEGVFDNPNYEISRARLNKCIAYHHQIIDFATRLDTYMADGMLIHLFITSAIIGCIENQIVTSNQFEGILNLIGWIFALFVGCLAGQHLWDASLTIPDAIYNSKWYTVEPKIQRDLILMLARSQKPLYLRAGSFGVLSFPLFVSIMKTSYSVLTLLKS